MAWFMHEGKWHRTGKGVRQGDMTREEVDAAMADTESLGSFLDDLSGLTDEEKHDRKALAKARKSD